MSGRRLIVTLGVQYPIISSLERTWSSSCVLFHQLIREKQKQGEEKIEKIEMRTSVNFSSPVIRFVCCLTLGRFLNLMRAAITEISDQESLIVKVKEGERADREYKRCDLVKTVVGFFSRAS